MKLFPPRFFGYHFLGDAKKGLVRAQSDAITFTNDGRVSEMPESRLLQIHGWFGGLRSPGYQGRL